MKLLLYCTKVKPYLYKTLDTMVEKMFGDYHTQLNEAVLTENLNGKIVAECDFEVEKINVLDCTFRTFNLVEKEILNKSCLTYKELFEYLKNRDNPRGYAIHIKNLHIFDEPKELSDYSRERKINTFEGYEWVYESIDKAPQNMMYAYDNKGNKYIVISIQSQWICLILNRIKDVEVRRVVLKEMLK